MSMSNDPGNFFQSAAALDNAARKADKAKNKHGDPIKLTSKILDVINDPFSSSANPAVFVAEAAGVVRKIDLKSRKITQTFRPSSSALAPLTCLAASTGSKAGGSSTLFAGCWDKCIYRWSIPTATDGAANTNKEVTSDMRFAGHTDFVKALLHVCVDGKNLLISGGADALLIVWDADSGKRLHTLKGHSRGVQTLAIDPLSRLASPEKPGAIIYSGDSNQEIRAWSISATHSTEIQIPLPKATPKLALSARQISNSNSSIDPLLIHETSIYVLRFSIDTGDLWTASADKTAKGLSFDFEEQSKTKPTTWQEDTCFLHPDFVRDVVIDDVNGYAITACRDEGVRVWDSSSGELIHCYDGHFEEVTGLAIVPASALGDESSRGQAVVSVSIDNTVRTWSLDPQKLKDAREEALRLMETDNAPAVVEKPKKESMLTAEEERELAELMDSDDD